MAKAASNRFRYRPFSNSKSSYWQLALYFALVACCAFGSTLASQLLVGRGSSQAIRWLCKCLMVMGTVSAVTTYFIHRAGETWDRYGVRWSAKAAGKAAAGIIFGILTGCAWTVLVWAQAPFHLGGNPSRNIAHLVFGVVATFAIGIGEEVGYRSYAMEQAQRVGGVPGALIIPTSIFVLAHLAGGMPWQTGLLVVGSCSLFYGVLMIATRSLPLVAAFHIGNNLVQDWILRTSNDSL